MRRFLAGLVVGLVLAGGVAAAQSIRIDVNTGIPVPNEETRRSVRMVDDGAEDETVGTVVRLSAEGYVKADCLGMDEVLTLLRALKEARTWP